MVSRKNINLRLMNLLNSLIAKLKEHSKTMILEAAAITAYQESHASPTI